MSEGASHVLIGIGTMLAIAIIVQILSLRALETRIRLSLELLAQMKSREISRGRALEVEVKLNRKQFDRDLADVVCMLGDLRDRAEETSKSVRSATGGDSSESNKVDPESDPHDRAPESTGYVSYGPFSDSESLLDGQPLETGSEAHGGLPQRSE